MCETQLSPMCCWQMSDQCNPNPPCIAFAVIHAHPPFEDGLFCIMHVGRFCLGPGDCAKEADRAVSMPVWTSEEEAATAEKKVPDRLSGLLYQ